MRRFALLGVLLALAIPATAAAATQNLAKGNVQTGSCEYLDFNATSNFNGTDASGSMTYTNPCIDPNLVYKGDVDCLSVTRDPVTGYGRATLAGHFTSVRNGAINPATTTGWIIFAEDNQSNGSSTGNPDRARFIFTGPFFNVFIPSSDPLQPPTLVPVPEPSCEPIQGVPTNPVLKGDIVIKDANIF